MGTKRRLCPGNGHHPESAVACTVPTTREHRGAAPIIYQRSIAAGSASAVIATAAEGG